MRHYSKNRKACSVATFAIYLLQIWCVSVFSGQRSFWKFGTRNWNLNSKIVCIMESPYRHRSPITVGNWVARSVSAIPNTGIVCDRRVTWYGAPVVTWDASKENASSSRSPTEYRKTKTNLPFDPFHISHKVLHLQIGALFTCLCYSYFIFIQYLQLHNCFVL